jgi:hypothetical protein
MFRRVRFLSGLALLGGLVACGPSAPPAPPAEKTSPPPAVPDKTSTGAVPAHLPGELSADDVLNGVYPYPPSPAVEVHNDATGLAANRLTPPPPPGVHPRILLSPGDLPDLRRRLAQTEAGRAMMATLRQRTGGSIDKPGTWENDLYNKLAAGDAAAALAIMNRGLKPSYPAGHYQPEIIYALVMESFDAMVSNDAVKGRKVGAALATYAAMAGPLLDQALSEPMNDDVWRVKTEGPATGNWSDNQGLREIIGYHNIGYAYDFAYNFMTDAQRDQVRSLIARATSGRVWMGARLPHHFRNWNWCAVGLGQPLLALAIEGEKGYDPRVYKMGVQIAQDYLTYAISPRGVSTEAVGYTQFGFVWATPFFVAASRRGDMLITNSHLRRMPDWYLQTLQPFGGVWQSHGDGADTGPAIWHLMMWRYFYPDDPRIDFLWQNYVQSTQGKPYADRYHIIEPLIWCTDGPAQPVDYAAGAKLNLPLALFDPARSSLMARSAWAHDAAAIEFECRTDSVGASHEHADRGVFTFSALGRLWARENFRSPETKFHNGITIDGRGQGFWPGPGKWLGYVDKGWALTAACDEKPAYDSWWPKEITTEPADFIRYQYARWSSYLPMSQEFHKNYDGQPIERDDRPSVVAHWTGFTQGDPRMWDEDTWPVRLAFNPVQRAFRTLAFVRSDRPYLMLVDDFQKDAAEHLYEWSMMTGPNTDIASIKDNDIVLCDATVPRDADGVARPKAGDRELLVRVLDLSDPAKAADFTTKPFVRLETIERKDTFAPGGRSFGLDRRLVLPSRSVAPNYKVMLFPLRAGEPLPDTSWNGDKTQLTVQWGQQQDKFTFASGPDGRTLLALERAGQETVALPAPVAPAPASVSP